MGTPERLMVVGGGAFLPCGRVRARQFKAVGCCQPTLFKCPVLSHRVHNRSMSGEPSSGEEVLMFAATKLR